MQKIIQLNIQPLTTEAFAPFGVLLGTDQPPTFDQEHKAVHRFDFAADSPTVLQIVSFRQQRMQVRKIEYHPHVTESRMHIAGAPTVIVVGRPGKKPPAAADLKAFLMKGQGVMFKRGTWHSIDAYPIDPDPGRFLFMSDRATQEEIFDNPTAQPVRTVLFDYEHAGVDVRIVNAENI